MPNKALVFNIISIVLQYSLLILLYYFLFRVIKLISKDLRKPSNLAAQQKSDYLVHEEQGKLVVVDHGSLKLRKRQFILGNTISIGRSEQNEVMIDDAFVSHEHAIINKTKQGYWLTDLKSTNKTYLNNQPVITEILLKNGDLIKIGAVTFRFEG